MNKNNFFSLALAMTLSLGIVGCGSSNPNTGQVSGIQAESGMVSDFHEAVKEVYGEFYIPSMPLDDIMMADMIGINMENVLEYVGEVPMMSTFVDTFIVIEAKEGTVSEVLAELEAYKFKLHADSTQYPMNLAKISAAQTFSIDDYAFFVMLGAMDEENETEAEQLEFAEEQIQLGVNAIYQLVQ